MTRVLLVLLTFILISQMIVAQRWLGPPPPPPPPGGVEAKPIDPNNIRCHYPGGDEAMMQWFTEHIEFSKIPCEKVVVYIKVAVDSTGRITESSIHKSNCHESNDYLLTMVNQMEPWNPQRKSGVASKDRNMIALVIETRSQEARLPTPGID